METGMLHALIMQGFRPGAGLLLSLAILLGVGHAHAASPPEMVAVQYRLLTEFTGTEQAGGRIVVLLTNRLPHALTKVTVRLAEPAVGKLTGPVQESIELAAGETRELEGAFMFDAEVVHASRPLAWVVVATGPEGFAQQTLVRGELMQGASMDAEARTVAR